jgi:hypothetical protein
MQTQKVLTTRAGKGCSYYEGLEFVNNLAFCVLLLILVSVFRLWKVALKEQG